MWLNFPLKPKINLLAKMVSFDTGINAQCHEDNETGRDTRNRLSERSKRKKYGKIYFATTLLSFQD
jgi:hypothetical protein